MRERFQISWYVIMVKRYSYFAGLKSICFTACCLIADHYLFAKLSALTYCQIIYFQLNIMNYVEPLQCKFHISNNCSMQMSGFFETQVDVGNSEFAIMVPPGGEATPNSSNPSHTLQLWKLITKFLGFMNIILSRSNSRIKR